MDEQRSTSGDEGPPGPRANILLVDDQPANLLALEAILAELGENLVRAGSGAEALQRLIDDDFAVVLLDLQMPDMDGFETARTIRSRERSRHTPIIFLTAHDPAAFPVAEAYTLGAIDYLTKPLVPEVLRAKVRGFVELFRKTEQIRRQADRLRELERRERLRAEEALRESEERQRLWIRCVKDYAVFLMDREGRVTSWNEGAERLTGYRAEDVLGRPFSLLFTPEDRAAGKPERELETAARTGSARDENWIVRKDGTRFWADGFSTALADDAGKLRGFGKICRDLTERKGLEEALRQRADELAEANRRKDEFLAMLGHELRNPLAPIGNALSVLHMRGADPPTVAWAEDISRRQLGHLTRLVDDLLDASRIQRGKIELRPGRVDLGGLVRTAAEDYRKILSEAGLSLVLELPTEPVWVRGDATRLAQVVGNLLNNAAKFSDPGGVVTAGLTVDEGARRAAVTVRDTGMGIDPDMLPRVFDTFAQADRSLHRSRGGLGLGLALVKGLVELHGGEVEAASEGVGRGATFTFRLPVESDLPAEPERPTAGTAAGTLRILLVEDHRDAAESLRVLLELSGHQVSVAHTGPAGVEAARTLCPDVVLCDVGLPGMDGYDVARTLREVPDLGKTRLIAVSGYGQEEDRRRALEAGFDQHMTKPVEPGALQRVLASVPAAPRAGSGAP